MIRLYSMHTRMCMQQPYIVCSVDCPKKYITILRQAWAIYL